MKRMRWQLIALVVWLTLLFNLERLDLDRQPRAALAPFVYILAAALVVALLLVPLRRWQMYLVALGVLALYALLKSAHQLPFFSGVNKYLTISEAGALLLSLYLAWLVGQGLEDFVQAVRAISLPEGRPRLLSYAQAQERMRTEMGRARRHQRPISVAMIELDPTTFEAALHQAVRDAQATMIDRYVQIQFGLFLSRHMRGTDVLARQDEDGRFLLVAPEAPGEQTAAMLARLARLVEEQIGIRFRYSIADFPNTALTSEELLRRAAEALQYASPSGEASGIQLGPAVTTGASEGYATMPIVTDAGLDERR